MIGGLGQSKQRPSAIGLTLTSSVYGHTIPVIYGRVRGALYLIWAENLRKHSSGKKLLFKKTQPTYAENVDFLIGQNPISGVLQMWENNNVKLPLTFTKYSTSTVYGNVTIPDADFYWLIAVTFSYNYNVNFNDFGATGPVNYTGTYEMPIWNIAMNGPNPTRSRQMDLANNTYFWIPGSGATVFIGNGHLGESYTPNFYYAKLNPTGVQNYSKKAMGTDVPIAALNLTFENVLGNGPEYGSTYAAQQILYPHYAGLGSDELDLGSGNMIPNLRPEILGAYNYYVDGDADFMDMVTDIFASLPQGGYDSGENATQLQHGLSCFDFPGFVQAHLTGSLYGTNVVEQRLPTKAGNFFVVASATDSDVSGGTTFTDVAGDLFTTVISENHPGSWGVQAGWGVASDYGVGNNVTVNPSGGHISIFAGELAGVDAHDTDVVAEGGMAAEITTTNDENMPAIIVAITFNFAISTSNFSKWTRVTTNSAEHFKVYTRVVYHPGTYRFLDAVPTGQTVVLMAFKSTNPATGLAGTSISRALGNIIDRDSMELTRQQCAAYGLWGSLNMDSQRKASEWLDEILFAANAAPVWSGFKLKIIPRAEASYVGNGSTYTSPTASGPIATLSDTNNDFVANIGEPPIHVKRTAQVDVPNILQIQHPNRDNNYNDVIISQPENASQALFGARKESPKNIRCIYDASIARKILEVMGRRRNYQRNTYTFTLSAKHKLLEPMDLVYINDQYLDIVDLPVRLTSIVEDENYNLACEAEDFFYGVNSPGINVTATTNAGYVPSTGADPGSINTPIIFEPVTRLTGGAQQLWLVVSGSVSAYAGCLVYISTDGGNSYNQLGQINGNAPTGNVTAGVSALNDPDTTEDILLDLTESLGTLSSYQVADEDNFTYPCYLEGGTADIPYELITYAIATLTGTNLYTLSGTGGNKIRRAVFGAPQSLVGVAHSAGSRFAFLSPDGTGILKVDMDPSWVGKTLYFKFIAFNSLFGGQGSLSTATPYTYTPAGTVGSGQTSQNYLNYTLTPASPLSQPDSTHISMVQCVAKFSTNSANYNARSFVIPDPGATPTTYYVTVYDPGYVGDTGSSTNLTAYCETSDARVGKEGYTYIGSVIAITGGGGAVTPGGWPLQQLFLINGA